MTIPPPIALLSSTGQLLFMTRHSDTDADIVKIAQQRGVQLPQNIIIRRYRNVPIHYEIQPNGSLCRVAGGKKKEAP